MSTQNEYRLTYHVSNEVTDSTRYTLADSDEHAISIFKYMTEKQDKYLEWHIVERWERFAEVWEALDLDTHAERKCDDR